MCTSNSRNSSELSIWILEDYGTDEWTLKHTVNTLNVFGKTNIQFGYVEWDVAYKVITVHPEWNLIFFVGKKEQSSHMTWIAEKCMSSLPVSFHMLHVVTSWKVSSSDLLSFLCSIVLGVISRGVNKVLFDVCHVAFDVSSLCWELGVGEYMLLLFPYVVTLPYVYFLAVYVIDIVTLFYKISPFYCHLKYI